MDRVARTSRPAFTLLELLIVISIIALLIGMVVPSYSAARNEALGAKCLSNLAAIGQALQAYATDDPEGFLIPVHPQAECPWRFDGEYEYGGGLSVVGGWLGNLFRLLSPETRVLNRYVYGDITNQGDFRLFRCPGDTGIVDAPRMFDPSLPVDVPIVDITGTSYRINNHIKMYSEQFFYGPYLRRAHRIPEPGPTVAIAETIAQVAIYNPPPFMAPGWHARAKRYNVAFADGHAGPITIQGGNELPREQYDGYWMFRGDGWRLDCYPDPPIADLFRNCPP